MAPGQILEGQLALFFCWMSLWGSLQMGTILPVDPPSAWAILKLHWPVRLAHLALCLSETPPHSTHKLPIVVHCQADAPTLPFPGAVYSWQKMALRLTLKSISERHLVADHWCQYKPQYLLGEWWGSVGPTQTTVGLTVICDLCGSLQT